MLKRASDKKQMLTLKIHQDVGSCRRLSLPHTCIIQFTWTAG